MFPQATKFALLSCQGTSLVLHFYFWLTNLDLGSYGFHLVCGCIGVIIMMEEVGQLVVKITGIHLVCRFMEVAIMMKEVKFEKVGKCTLVKRTGRGIVKKNI